MRLFGWVLVLCCLSFFANAEDMVEQLIEDQMQAQIYPTPVESKIATEKKDFTDSEIMLLQNLESKRIELERKSQVLMIREKLIDLSELRLLDKITKLENLEKQIKDLLKQVSDGEEKRLADLATVYAEMKPALAAERLNVLDDITVYEVLKRMSFKQSAKILEKMNVEKVKVVSKMLAEKTLLPVLKK